MGHDQIPLLQATPPKRDMTAGIVRETESAHGSLLKSYSAKTAAIGIFPAACVRVCVCVCEVAASTKQVRFVQYPDFARIGENLPSAYVCFGSLLGVCFGLVVWLPGLDWEAYGFKTGIVLVSAVQGCVAKLWLSYSKYPLFVGYDVDL